MPRSISLGLPILVATTVLLSVQAISAQDGHGVPELTRAIIARSVVDREPVDPGTVFPADVGRVACFTQIQSAASQTHIIHVWYWKDQEMARVELPVRSLSWRTWSTKRILSEWVGPWKVVILDPDGTELGTLPFEVSGSASKS
ncbi:MAG: DUF2914 domain-containing protein [Candidatus Eisenbacteria sp.]|nr:DUF2914 domain-containing protein [Candidatus Eisenbacteria bacterium]